MSDTRVICFTCGPVARFSTNPVPGAPPGAVVCAAPSTFGIGPSGSAELLLDGSITVSLGALVVDTFEWTDNGSPINSNPFSAQLQVPLGVGTHDIELTAYDTAGAFGKTTQTITVVMPPC